MRLESITLENVKGQTKAHELHPLNLLVGCAAFSCDISNVILATVEAWT